MRESLGDASPGARAESIQTMKRTRRILVARPGSRVEYYTNEKKGYANRIKEVNRIGHRVCDVIADGDALDRGLELSKRSIVSGPRVINTLSSGTEGLGQVWMAFPDPCS
jgi:hypothetical protein